MNRTFPLRWSISLLAAATALGGCTWFHHSDNYYAKAEEARPLEVPPDLDTPVSSNELVVPAAGTSTSSTTAAATSPPATAAAVGTAPPAASNSVLSGSGLHVADTVAHTWQRVGLALERGQVGNISARDESGYSYNVDVSGLSEAPAPTTEHHWYSRILHPFGGGKDTAASKPVSGHVTVKVSADGDGARVDVEGDPTDSTAAEAAKRVLDTLRARLS